MLPSFFLGLCSFSIFWPSWPPLGAIWARFGKLWGSILDGFWVRFWKVFGLDFGKFSVLFWRLLATIWAYDSSWKTCSFNPFCWRLVLDGLVGLREAQRISLIFLPILRGNLSSFSATARGASPPRTPRILHFPKEFQ